MTPGQSRVVVMLLILLGLEALRMPAIKTFFHGAYTQFNTGLNAASPNTITTTTAATTTGSGTP